MSTSEMLKLSELEHALIVLKKKKDILMSSGEKSFLVNLLKKNQVAKALFNHVYISVRLPLD